MLICARVPQVIAALAESQGSGAHIPYRDSKLTKVHGRCLKQPQIPRAAAATIMLPSRSALRPALMTACSLLF